jgi:hypothetical protein
MRITQKPMIVLIQIAIFVSVWLFSPALFNAADISPRLTDNGNGTVTDNFTGLTWLKNANCFGSSSWVEAVAFCKALENGQCGLADGSSAGDWRLPNIRELHGLIDYHNYNPALPSGYPFTDVRSNVYWSSSVYAGSDKIIWTVGMYGGFVSVVSAEERNADVWPVRGSN